MFFNMYNKETSRYVNKITFKEELVSDYKEASVISINAFMNMFYLKDKYQFVLLPDDYLVYNCVYGNVEVSKIGDNCNADTYGCMYDKEAKMYLKVKLVFEYADDTEGIRSTSIVDYFNGFTDRFAYSSRFKELHAFLCNLDKDAENFSIDLG